MKRLILIAVLLATACSGGPPRQRYPGVALRPAANPSAVIAAEIGFAQLAQEKGQWTAFRATATQDAEMFVPQRTNAQAWLKGRADPPKAIRWQPYQVWSSCDGSFAVTRGGWTTDQGAGFFNTVWQRQEDGGYKWVLDLGDDAQAQSTPPEMIAAKVATCPARGGQRPALTVPIPDAGVDSRTATSRDGTLGWTSEVLEGGKHRFVVQLWNGQGFDRVLDTAAPAGAPR